MQLAGYLTALFGKAPDRDVAPGKLAEFSRNLHSILAVVHNLVTVIDDCPNRAELDRAAMTGKVEGIDGFFGRADRALRRLEIRQPCGAG